MNKQEKEESLIRGLELLKELAVKWVPHDKQVELLSAVLFGGINEAVCKWGRRCGKSESVVVLIGLWAMMVKDAHSYYVAPQLNQAKEILWANNKIYDVLPHRWIKDSKETELRILFANGENNYLKIGGCDKVDSLRGIEPSRGLLILDECREMPDNTLQVLQPTLARWDSPLILISSPPEKPFPYKENPERKHWFNQRADTSVKSKRKRYFHATTADNPHINREWLEETEAELISLGRQYEWEREYMAKDVVGGEDLSFPMLAADNDFLFPHEDLLIEIEKDKSKMQWYCMTDPAGSSVWAWLLIGYNPYTKIVYLLDEVYETEKDQMVTSIMWPKAKGKMLTLYDEEDDWELYYDVAETWFANEMINTYDIAFNPCDKVGKTREDGIRTLGMMFHQKLVKVSKNCKHTWWELQNYTGVRCIHDHNIDNFRYFLTAADYSVVPKARTKQLKRVRGAVVTVEEDEGSQQINWGETWLREYCND